MMEEKERSERRRYIVREGERERGKERMEGGLERGSEGWRERVTE